ncbi:family 43 glycosylhydrolase, partial [Bacteroides uniformis]
MKHLVICIALLTVGACCFAQQKKVASHKATSGNPVFQGWYADPEGIIYDDTYWIFPTWSDLYENQTFFDCFSSKDLVNWTKHASVLDTTAVKWAKKAMWAPSVIRKNGKYYI